MLSLSHVSAAPPPPQYVVPTLIKRNTLWLALSQMFGGAGVNLTFSLGPLMVVALLGSSTLAGVSVAMHSISRFVAAYPFGRVTDQFGRRPGVVLGLVLGLVGTVTIGLSMTAGSFVGLILGLLVFGVGMNGIQQLRLAAAEMYPPAMRATVIGLILTGALVGVVISPVLVSSAEALAPVLGVHPLGMPWLLVPVLIVPSIVMIWRVRPDPRDIAANLERYYPGYQAPPDAATGDTLQRFTPGEFFGDPHRRISGVAMFSAHGSMQIAMVTAPLVMVVHGVTLPAVALSMAIHTAGMYATSIPMGKLTDRIGRRNVLLLGTLVEAIGGGITAFTGDYVLITLGIFLVGVGWCAANVSSTAIVVDSTNPAVRGRAIGVLDSLAAVAGLIFSVIAGPLAEYAGLGATGVLAMLLMVPPAVLLLQPGALRTAQQPAA